MRNVIFSTIIIPPLIFGVTGSFAFLILFLLFTSVILIKGIFGVVGLIIAVSAVAYFFFYGRKRTAKDPYWLNITIMAFLFERKRSVQFIKRCFTKKDKILYR